MYEPTENAALVMRWVLEADASGRMRPVAHWLAAQPAPAVVPTAVVPTAVVPTLSLIHI